MTEANEYIDNVIVRVFVRARWIIYELVCNAQFRTFLTTNEIISVLESADDSDFIQRLQAQERTFDVIVSTTEQILDYISHYNDTIALIRALSLTSNKADIRSLVLWLQRLRHDLSQRGRSSRFAYWAVSHQFFIIRHSSSYLRLKNLWSQRSFWRRSSSLNNHLRSQRQLLWLVVEDDCKSRWKWCSWAHRRFSKYIARDSCRWLRWSLCCDSDTWKQKRDEGKVLQHFRASIQDTERDCHCADQRVQDSWRDKIHISEKECWHWCDADAH